MNLVSLRLSPPARWALTAVLRHEGREDQPYDQPSQTLCDNLARYITDRVEEITITYEDCRVIAHCVAPVDPASEEALRAVFQAWAQTLDSNPQYDFEPLLPEAPCQDLPDFIREAFKEPEDAREDDPRYPN